MRPVYFDHAATSWPKPESVLLAAEEAVRYAGGNPGRGTHPLAETASEMLYACREEAADFFGSEPERTVFTPGATYSLNMAIRGLAEPGCHILIDGMAHNALLRPVLALEREGICRAEVYSASADGEDLLADLESKIRPETKIVAATHQSNICSRVLPVERIAAFCRERGLHFVLDAAQSAGRIPISADGWGISALCVPGHKGLNGFPGVGLLILGKDVKPKPLVYGGAGIRSLEEDMPSDLPERLEPGTLPLPAIAALLAGIRGIRAVGQERIALRERELSRLFVRGLGGIPDFRTAGETDGNVVSILHREKTPSEVGEILAQYGICVRTGYHCAPIAHRTLGTEKDGTVRVSFSASNSEKDVERILNVLGEID